MASSLPLSYSDIHIDWQTAYDNRVWISSTSNITPYSTTVYKNGQWIPIHSNSSITSPRLLLRHNGVWEARVRDYWILEVCGTAPNVYPDTHYRYYTIPSTMFGMSVNKVAIYPVFDVFFYTKQYGGGTGFHHELTKNGSRIAGFDGKHDNAGRCSPAYSWAYRGIVSPSATVFYPGDTIGVKVVVAGTVGADEGGTKVSLSMKWYFN